MIKRKSKYPIAFDLEITGLAAEGKSFGHYNEKIIFVANTIPGDVVHVQICNARRRFYEGFVVEYKKKSDDRVEPFCSHFGECGGCKWQALPYNKQLEFKQQQVFDQLTRIAAVDIPQIKTIVGSEKTEWYRNKLEFTFSNKRWIPRHEIADKDVDVTFEPGLGYHTSGQFDKVLDIKKCYLQSELSNEIRLAVKKFTLENQYPYYNLRTHDGLMRNIIIRTSTLGQVMVIIVLAIDEREKVEALLNYLKSGFPQITSLNYIINNKLNDSIGDQKVINFSGQPYMEEKMEDLIFRINPKSFFQTNSEQALKLYEITREFADLQPTDVVYDLYTGTGTIANFVAKRCSKVVGVEYVVEAIIDAKINSEINNIGNTSFFAGDMKDVLNNEFISKNGRPDVVILDPPRAGIHENVANVILNAEPQRIVYVSCNPATQARDLAIFDAKYKVTKVQPVDMFPHTHHVENVVQLIKR